MMVSAIVLCGGRGLRAGGVDKGLLPWGQSTLVKTVLERLAPQVDDIVISANRNIDQYGSLGYPVVSDQLIDYQGPLAGIAAAMEKCQHSIIIVAPCDMPKLPGDLVERLLPPLEQQRASVSFAHDGEREQYLLAAIRADSAADLRQYLQEGGRSVRGWYARLANCAVDFSDSRAAFANLNSPSPG
jgi:molybdenum cofactor guanylyltransferase